MDPNKSPYLFNSDFLQKKLNNDPNAGDLCLFFILIIKLSEKIFKISRKPYPIFIKPNK